MAQLRQISIHALREEGDDTRILLAQTGSYFYPRPPRGGRQLYKGYKGPETEISIHALREEGDGTDVSKTQRPNLFLSTPSARRATCSA